jgi:hypothetical protein
MKTPPITKKQKEIIYYLYKFRFLNTHQIQTLLEHKNPNRSLAWLKDLIEKNYVKRQYERKSFIDNTKPAQYYLGPTSRQILKSDYKLHFEELEYIYQEHRRDKKFISHCLFLADIYIYLNSQKEAPEELKFFTKNELRGYEYFPDPLPDSFIATKGAQSTKRYFLDLFDEYTPAFAIRNRVRMYMSYVEQPEWDEHTDSAPFPTILLICANESTKRHIMLYAKALLEKTFDDKVSFFLTTKNNIHPENKDIWEKVVI